MKILLADHTGLLKLIRTESGALLAKTRLPPASDPAALRPLAHLPASYLLVANPPRLIQLTDESIDIVSTLAEPSSVSLVDALQLGDKVLLLYSDFSAALLTYSHETYEYKSAPFPIKAPKGASARGGSFCAEKKQILIYGKQVSPIVVDSDSGKTVWQARNVQNDYLDLKEPRNDLAGYLVEGGDKALTVTRHGEVRFYDVKMGKRQPIFRLKLKDKEVPNACALSSDQSTLAIGLLHGATAIVGVTTGQAKHVGYLKGHPCSVTAVSFSDDSAFCCVGYMNRFVRMFRVQGRQCVKEVNVGQRAVGLCVWGVGLDEQLLQDKEIEKEEQRVLLKDPKVNRARLSQLKRSTINLPYLKPRKLKKQE